MNEVARHQPPDFAVPQVAEGEVAEPMGLADAEHGFEAEDNAIELIGREGEVVAVTAGSKRRVAAVLWDAVVALRG